MDGERAAARHAAERIRARLAELRGQGEDIEVHFGPEYLAPAEELDAPTTRVIREAHQRRRQRADRDGAQGAAVAEQGVTPPAGVDPATYPRSPVNSFRRTYVADGLLVINGVPSPDKSFFVSAATGQQSFASAMPFGLTTQ